MAYLAVEAGREHTRGNLAELLWPEQPDVIALSNLRYSLSDLRHALGDTPTPTANPILIVTREFIRLNLDADCWLDAREFIGLCDGGAASAEDQIERRHLEKAVALYHGPFLQGFSLPGSAAFEDWLFWTREQFQRKAIGALRRLVTLHVRAGDYAAAQCFAQRQVQLEPLDEIAHRQLMHTLALGGERSAALTQFERCRQMLAEELHVEPTDETAALVEMIRAGVFEHSATLPAPAEIRLPVHSPAPALTDDAGLPPAFVARDRELEQLDRYLAGALAGHGRVVFVTGDAGSGKTALMQEFMRRALDIHPSLVAADGSCNAAAGIGDPYLPFRDILQMLSGDVEARRAGHAVTPNHTRLLWALLPYSVQALVEQGPDLIDRFVPVAPLLLRSEAVTFWPGGAARGAALRARLAELARARPDADGQTVTGQADMFEQVVRVLRCLSAQQPLLLALDDLQWADQGTVSLLFHLGRRLGRSRILLMGAYRPDDVALGRGGDRHPLEAVVNEMKREFGETAVDLDAAPGRAFVDALLAGEPNRLSETFAAALYQHTDGHALFTVEMLRGLQERGDLARDEHGCWHESPQLDWAQLPVRVEAVIAERIGRLPHEWQMLLAAASVEGGEFTAEVVARLLTSAGRTQAELQKREEEVSRLLSRPLRDQQMVVARSLRRLRGRRLSRYRFWHTLFQKYLYSSLDPVARAKAHEVVANTLEELYQEDRAEIAVNLAWHFERAGLPLPAARYLLEAGRRAVRLAAYQEALAHYTRGLELLATAPSSPDRDQLGAALDLARGVPLFGLYGWSAPQRAHTFTQAAVHGADADLVQNACLLFVQADFCVGRGDYRQAAGLGRRLLALAQSSGHRQTLMLGRYILGLVSFAAGDLVSARASFEAVLQLYREAEDEPLLALIPIHLRLVSLGWLAHVLWIMGYPEQADRDMQQAVALARREAQPMHLAVALATDANYVILCGIDRDIAPEVGELRALAEAGDLAMFLAWTDVHLGYLAARQGDVAGGVARIERGVAAWRSLGIIPLVPMFLLLRARVCHDGGLTQEGLQTVAEALALIEQGIGHYPEAELYRLKGELLLKKGEAETNGPDAAGAAEWAAQAESCFLKAIEIARRQQARSWELRATASLACLRQRMRGGPVAAPRQPTGWPRRRGRKNGRAPSPG
ncbi:MAG: AAA family ATPase [Caldilineaceae bacterium]|nr:AAA family ATPase [Caldilineaceae bacterium]